jgi:hypothetical protein
VTEPSLDLVDHHCHGIVTADLDRPAFEAMLTEASRPSPLGTTLFDSMLGFAVRRWCAPTLGLEPLVDAEVYLARRRELGPEEVAGRLLRATGTRVFLVDTGYRPAAICTPADLARLAGGTTAASEIVRLESLAEDLLADGTPATKLAGRVVAALHDGKAVGAKCIAAYRSGLELPADRPSDAALVAGLDASPRTAAGRIRLADPRVHAWLAWTALEAGVPVQFHVGFGDSDLDLHRANPLLLTAFLRATEGHGVPVLLLHNYPYHREAAYLAQVFEHVFVDVGLATHNSAALSGDVIREVLEVVPFGKLLYSSDAFGLPELYHLAALFFRRGLTGVLEGLVSAGEASRADADRISGLVLAGNAARVYGLDPGPAA